MTEFLMNYGLFLAETLTAVLAVLACAGGIVAILGRTQRHQHREHLEVKHLNRHFEDLAFAVNSAMQSPKARRKSFKLRRKQRKHETAQEAEQGRLFVLDFHGDIRASGVNALREEVNAILSVARDNDEVLVRLDSPGGLVHTYGLAASQMVRLKDKGLKLTVAVDKVAASGGYLMACVADRLLAAPFAIIGSIGVVAQVPNFHRLLEKNQVDYELFTAGEYKRTVTVFGENTPEGKQKFQAQLEDVHGLFKDFVATHRPQLDLPTVATGEYWYGARALALSLVDELQTSDDYLLAARERMAIYTLHYRGRKTLRERLGGAARNWLGGLERWLPGG